MNSRGVARALSALVWLATGCDRGNDCDPSTETCQGFTINRCEPLRAPCDIREASCQREVFRATACERGQPDARLPNLRVITRTELRQEVEAQLAQAQLTALDRAWDRGSKLLGLVPSDQGSEEISADLFVDGIAAYYSSRDRGVTIIEDSVVGRDVDLNDGTFVLSHEYIHALQDQRDSLRDLYSDHASHTDSVVALDALVEGEATLLSNFVMASMNGREPEELPFDLYFEDMLEDTLTELDQSAAPLMAALEILPYPVGGRGLWRTFLRDGSSASFEALYSAPILTLAEWLSPTATQEGLSCGAPGAPSGHALVIADQLGVVGLLALEIVLGAGTGALDEPVRWRGDYLSVFATDEDDPESVAVALRLRLRDEFEAGRLASRIEARELPNSHLAQTGPELLLVATERAETLESWDFGACPEQKAVPKGRSSDLLANRLRKRLGWYF